MTLQDFNCVLCNNGATEESLTHLFLSCPFATQCWAWLNIQVDPSLDPFQNLQSFKDQLQVPLLHGGNHFDELDNLESAK